MKKTIVVLIALVMGSVLVFAQSTNEVGSVNAVGYVRVNAPEDSFTFVSVPFHPMDGEGKKVSELLGDFPVGTKAFYWKAGSQSWGIENYITNGFFFTSYWDPDTNIWQRGDAIFLGLPASVGDKEVVMKGEVPTEGSNNIPTVIGGFVGIGYSYPVAMSVTNLEFNTAPKVGDRIYYWKPGQTWGIENYITNGFFFTSYWDPGTLVVEPGQGLLYRSDVDSTFQSIKPYADF